VFTFNLRNYVFRRNKRRLRDDRVSLVLAFAFSMLMLALGLSERAAAISGVVVLGISMCCWTVYFCCNAPKISADLRHASSSRYAILYLPVSRRLASISVLMLGIVFSRPEIEAAVLDRRLRRLTEGGTLVHDQAEGVAEALRTAVEADVKLPSKTVLRVRDAVMTSALQRPQSSGIPDAVMAISGYARANSSLGRSPGWDEYRVGDHHRQQVFRDPLDLTEADQAIQHYTRALELADGDVALRIAALLARARMLYSLSRYDESYSDAEAARGLGALDLSDIIDIEGWALVGSVRYPRPKDEVRRGVDLLTIAMQLDPPDWAVNRPGGVVRWRGEQLFARGRGYYVLGDYEKAITDLRGCLASGAAGFQPAPLQDLTLVYQFITVAQLELGRLDDALGTVSEWEMRADSARAARAREIIEANRSDLQRAISLLR
jgi:tetratricopeptide (TPR) repeat protein